VAGLGRHTAARLDFSPSPAILRGRDEPRWPDHAAVALEHSERARDSASTDIVRSRSAAARQERPPLLILEPVEEHLDALGLGSGPADAQELPGGHSNATFLLRREGCEVVLRRPPRPPLPPGAHDVVREARVMRALGDTAVPVPRILSICEDTAPIGAPFVVMELVEGHVLEGTLPAALDLPGQRNMIGEVFVDALVDVHAVDVQATGLAGWLGRPSGYLERQLRRFSGSWEVSRTRELPAMDELARLLRERMPESGPVTLVHGDPRLGNAIFAPRAPARVAALLDWEMATLGDPLADLGYFCASWTDASDNPPPMFHLSTLTGSPGFPTRSELVGRYEQRSGRRVRDLPWYTALAFWKSAVFMEGNYRRAVYGMSDDPLLLGFRSGVEELAELGLAALSGRS
jgi:aminoglycoside phosphotransferase (APT) family kinase protein